MGKISKYFSLEEMLESQTAVRKNILEQFDPSDAVVENLKKLTNKILDHIREKLGSPIVVSSGYRCKRLNKSIGGAIDSQHTEGKAADIKSVVLSPQSLFDFILELDLPFDQIIQEFDSWVHISFDEKRNRRQILKAIKKNGKTQYIKI